MYLTNLKIRNIRTISTLEIDFGADNLAGWHVLVGNNGAGKSTVVKSIGLLSIDPEDHAFLLQNWDQWVTRGRKLGQIEARFQNANPESPEQRAHYLFPASNPHEQPYSSSMRFPNSALSGEYRRSISQLERPWLSASFGPFRRFGSEKEIHAVFKSNPHVASHITAFTDDVPLNASLEWLQSLQFRSLEAGKRSVERAALSEIIEFINQTQLLPGKMGISSVTSEGVFLKDPNGKVVSTEELSDGFRSILSLAFEMLCIAYLRLGPASFVERLDLKTGEVRVPGVVSIDEIDAHLHPSWQKEIGEWFISRFPQIQFIVTTHSPIICRAAARGGSIWRLPDPGTNDKGGKVVGSDLNKLLYGDILDAFSTDIFGDDLERSEGAHVLLTELAILNVKSMRDQLSVNETRRLAELRSFLPTPVSAAESINQD